MQSKINSADLINITRYFIYKIQTSNFENIQVSINDSENKVGINEHLKK